MWNSSTIRKAFLDYFQERDHTIIESSSLVPINDPTLLFANAGMNQFKDLFLGIEKRGYDKAATSQKCVRAGGKRSDLEIVGKTKRHHTFFEMLGNFSFGDYFKREAIFYAWDFLTREVELPREKLYITIFEDDDEAHDLWQEIANVDPSRIIRMGEEDNFWAMGDTGPCGPCSEIMYDRGEEHTCDAAVCGLGHCDCDRWLELWNLVFMQYNKEPGGELSPLPKPSIDTGMGLERIASVLQKVDSNFDTDLFIPIIEKIEELAGQKYQKDDKGFPFRVIADHSRACTFLIGDGVIPSNDGRGYVLRRILRRAVRFGKFLGIERPFLYQCVDVVSDIMKDTYPDLEEKKDFIKQVIQLEEERFLVTLNEGIKKVEEIIRQARKQERNIILGEEAFMLYDTYGFPIDLTEDMAEEKQFSVDKQGFETMMEQQRERARKAGKAEHAFAQDKLFSDLLAPVPATIFTGYDTLEQTSTVLAIILNGVIVETVSDENVYVVLAQTPFYAESGGQVTDTGMIKNQDGLLQVESVRQVSDWIIHYGKLEGTLSVAREVDLKVDAERRLSIARNHTATHLLHRALRSVLGEHAQQKGSLVEPDRLRFDFTHLQAVTLDEMELIERKVNEAIWQLYQVETTSTSLQKARDMGATALFGEAYGEQVRVLEVGDYSMELCGGTHVQNTGEIGVFKIINEGSIGAGLRRIEATTAMKAFNMLKESESQLKEIAGVLRSHPGDVPSKIEALNKTIKKKEKEIEGLKSRLSKVAMEDMASKAYEINGVKILVEEVPGQDMNSLRQNAERLRDVLGTSVIVLASALDDKVAIVSFASKDVVGKGIHAGDIVGAASSAAGGGGGGRPDMAQAGAKDVSKIPLALQAAKNYIESKLD